MLRRGVVVHGELLGEFDGLNLGSSEMLEMQQSTGTAHVMVRAVGNLVSLHLLLISCVVEILEASTCLRLQ
jgi:hypothetical protein